jgi:hypothetical protein
MSRLTMSKLSVLNRREKADLSRSRAMAVASLFGFCAIFSLKEAHDIAREVESSNPAHPASFNPFLEVGLNLPVLDLMLTLPGTISKNRRNSSKDGFSSTTCACKEPGYAASNSSAEEWNIHASVLLGHAPRPRERETKPM